MAGPLPKNPILRQRRNKVTTRAILPAELPRESAPELPTPATGKPWHVMTIQWWNEIWVSPMAGEYLRADEHALFRLAMLVDMFWNTPTIALAKEIRVAQQAFGLTPIDRRRLEWSVEQAEEAKQKGAARKKREKKVQDRGTDPRAILDGSSKAHPADKRPGGRAN